MKVVLEIDGRTIIKVFIRVDIDVGKVQPEQSFATVQSCSRSSHATSAILATRISTKIDIARIAEQTPYIIRNRKGTWLPVVARPATSYNIRSHITREGVKDDIVGCENPIDRHRRGGRLKHRIVRDIQDIRGDLIVEYFIHYRPSAIGD